MAVLPKSVGSLIPMRDYNAMLVSAIVHLTAMIALGAFMAVGELGSQPLELLASVNDAAIAPDQGDSLALDKFSVELAEDEAAAAAGTTRMFESPALATADLAALRAPLELSALESGRDGAALGVLGQAEGHFARGASQFFGVNGYGQTFVYVVDCSGSMRNSGKLERAKYELLHSIEQLSGDQKYFVIFYNQTAIPMNEQAPVDAGDATLAQTRRWIEMVEPGGGTNPLPALLAALALKPDTIFFLSDGLFDSNTIAQVRTINRRRGRVPIHSIAFVSRENLALMRAIARDSGGEFRFVK